MKKTLLGLAVAGALASSMAHAVPGVFFDENGASGAGVIVSQFVWNVDNALLYQGTGTSSGQAYLLAVGRLDNASGAGGVVMPNPGHSFTYELQIPVNVSDNVGSLKLTFDLTRLGDSFFKMYHTTGTVNQSLGTGYGVASGGTGTEILSGTATFAGGSMTLTYDTDDNGNINKLKIGDPIGNSIPTLTIAGSRTINIELDTQDSAYFRSDLEASLSFDMSLLSQAFTAPYPTTGTPVVAAQVMGITPNLGAGGVPIVTHNPETGAINGTTTNPLNDNLCNGGGGHDGSILTTTDCDIRLSTGQGNLQILAEVVPAPGSLALLGLGLGLLGAGIRRRQSR